MAELLVPNIPAAGAQHNNGGASSRPTAPPAQTGSPSRGIRGPRMIMQERQEREARQRAEREQMERIRAEEEARALEESRRAAAAADKERERQASGVARHTNPLPQEVDPAIQRRQQRAAEAGRTAHGFSQAVPHSQIAQPGASKPGIQISGQFENKPTGGAASSTAGARTEDAAAGTSNRPRNSFPHAFERWEALSAHWEGLTSFWMRQLQQRSEIIDKDPMLQQLSRQITDLSAAGANLFHAVVELQRLRASSERKFQRWFFETRSDQERSNEINGMLEAALEEERRGRADAIRDAVEHERTHSKYQKQLAEMRKELSISKEEARRAWEELGRREQEERDRTISLQQGLPTIVGGVQVVPMTQSAPSRHTSIRDPRGQPETDVALESTQEQAEYSRAPKVQTAPIDAGTPHDPVGYYQPPPVGAHQRQSSYGGESEGGYSEEDFETPASQAPTSYPPSSSQHYTGDQDYSGQGYGAPSWETMPRHHHPTRLSDVIEEDDERSRTSASQVSRA